MLVCNLEQIFLMSEATLANDSQGVTIAENNYNLALLSLSQLLQVPYQGFDVQDY